MPDAPIFVVGVARSGTTLLASMLAAHPRLDCGPESRFFARYRHLSSDEQARTLDPASWPGPAIDFIASLRNQGHPVVELFGLDVDDIRDFLVPRSPSLAAMLESLTVLHARAAGKPRWVEKTPRHLLMTERLRALWPDASIIRIVRDPRDVALSLAGMPFAKASVVGNLVRVDQDDRASRERIEADARAVTLRYEDLVTRPEAELRRVCAFLGEDYAPSMLEERTDRTSVAAEHEWWKESVAGPLNSASVGRWHREMAPEIQHFAGLHLAGYLRTHGYEGARDARAQVGLVPVGDAVGPGGERLLLDLAARDLIVQRPAPLSPRQLHAQGRLVFVGTRGQLDPSRGRSIVGRAVSTVMLAAGLVLRRMQRRPIGWLRRSTLRRKRPRDANELLVSLLLRLGAQRLDVEDVVTAVDPE